jgi:hypothetical protein
MNGPLSSERRSSRGELLADQTDARLILKVYQLKIGPWRIRVEPTRHEDVDSHMDNTIKLWMSISNANIQLAKLQEKVEANIDLI